MPGYVNVIVVGDTAGVQAMLVRLDDAISPVGLGLWMTAFVDPYLRARSAERFSQEGDDVSGKWLPLSAGTQAIRAQQGYPPSHPINRRSGRLEDYIVGTRSSVISHTAGSKLVYPGTAPQGETADKVRVAQQGFSAGGMYTPPRPVLGMNERDLAAILLGLANHVGGVKP